MKQNINNFVFIIVCINIYNEKLDVINNNMSLSI